MRKFEKVAQNVYFLEMPADRLGETVVFINGNRRFLVDCGSCDYSVTDVIIPALKAMGYGLKDIDYIVFTHCHPENFGGAHKLRELADKTKIVAYATQRETMKNPTYYLNKICSFFPDNAPPYSEIPGILPNEIIKPNDEEPIFSELIPFRAEGHTADSVLWYHPASGVLISGDAFQGDGLPENGLPYAQFSNCYRDVLEEYESTRRVNYRTIITGRRYYNGSCCINGEEECRRFVSAGKILIDEKKAAFEAYLKQNRLQRTPDSVQQYVSEIYGSDNTVNTCYPLITYLSMITPNDPEGFFIK